jgi:hypothetical protein
MKLQCVMKDSWAINNFPFDKQKLRFSIENSQFDSHSLVFVPDTLGKHFDPRFTLRGWRVDSLGIAAGIKEVRNRLWRYHAWPNPIPNTATLR